MRTFRVTFLKPSADGMLMESSISMSDYQKVRLLMSADNKQQVVNSIASQGGIVIAISQVSSFQLYFVKPQNQVLGARILQAILFCVEGGMTPGKALNKVLEDLPSKLPIKSTKALELLSSGASFTEAIKALKLFDSTSLAMLESGESSGGVRDSIRATIAHIQSSNKSFKALIGAVSWTFIDMIFAIVSILGLRIQFLPMLMKQASDIKKEEHKLEFLQAIHVSTLACDVLAFTAILLLVVGILLFLGFQNASPHIKNTSAQIIGRIPGLGRALFHASIASSAGVSARMMRGGVSFIDTLDIASRSAQMPQVASIWVKVKLKLESGSDVIAALSSKLFLPSESLLIASHATQEQLCGVFENIAHAREELSTSASKIFAIFGFISSLIYTGITVLLVLWVVYIQNKYLLQGVNN
jgi:type II secretory pathway component PulF